MKFRGCQILFLSLAVCAHAAPSGLNGEKIPVIDIHTHVFNAHDLPIYGILRAQEIFGVPVPGSIARLVEMIILHGVPGESLADSGLREGDRVRAVLKPDQFKKLSDYVATNDASFSRLSVVHDDDGEVTLAARIFQLTGVFGREDPGSDDKTLSPNAASSGYIELVKLLRLRRSDIVQKLKDTYEVELSVHHMMDMEKAYKEAPTDDFPHQLVIFDNLDAAEKGRILRFVAYDPFRGRQESLKLVQSGWAAGAAGVKFYPPSGYSPASNEIEKRPCLFNPLTNWEARRWKSAYGGTTPEELNETVASLLDWAVPLGVPLFAHTDIDTVQPVSSYWKKADPDKWEERLLQKNPDGKLPYADLRLCFAHGGGDSFWASDPAQDQTRLASADPADAPWQFGAKIVTLCQTHPNVYLELGCLQSVMSAKGREVVIARLVHELRKPGGRVLAKKIMYGTDWHMLIRSADHRNYLADFDTVITEVSRILAEKPDGAMPDLRQDFFAGNALRFLNLTEQAKDRTRFSQEIADRWTTAFSNVK